MMAKFIEFKPLPNSEGKRPGTWTVHTKKEGAYLGDIEWWGRWRCYTFSPSWNSVYEHVCLRDIADFCEEQTRAHKQRAKESA